MSFNFSEFEVSQDTMTSISDQDEVGMRILRYFINLQYTADLPVIDSYQR